MIDDDVRTLGPLCESRALSHEERDALRRLISLAARIEQAAEAAPLVDLDAPEDDGS